MTDIIMPKNSKWGLNEDKKPGKKEKEKIKWKEEEILKQKKVDDEFW